jgi:magnesium chelatase family protein
MHDVLLRLRLGFSSSLPHHKGRFIAFNLAVLTRMRYHGPEFSYPLRPQLGAEYNPCVALQKSRRCSQGLFMLSIIQSGALVGLDAVKVTVEVDYNPRGMTGFTIVGLPDAAVQESRERVRSAIRNCRLEFPLRRYVVNLAPAEMRKEGPAYDLPIAMGVLAATEQLPPEGLDALDDAVFVGELSLDGSLRHVRGVMSFAYMTRELGYSTLYVPECDAPEAALVDGIDIIPVPSLGHLVEHIFKLNPIPPYDRNDRSRVPAVSELAIERLVDFSDVKG